jgi:hypothetical protein
MTGERFKFEGQRYPGLGNNVAGVAMLVIGVVMFFDSFGMCADYGVGATVILFLGLFLALLAACLLLQRHGLVVDVHRSRL